MAEYAYKFALYPSMEQEIKLNKNFGCVRWVYNACLDKRKSYYEETGKTFNRFDCQKLVTQLRHDPEYFWLEEADSTALQQAVHHLDDAYQRFFAHLSNYPKFKKKCNRQSYTTINNKGNIKIFDDGIKLPKIGKVKCKVTRTIEGRILSATISKETTGKYFVSVLCTEVDIEPLEKTNQVCGIDMGQHTYCTFDNGNKIDNPKFLTQSLPKTKRANKNLSRKKKGSANYEKARKKKAKIEAKIAAQRLDFQHKLSKQIVSDYDIICIENLNANEMTDRKSKKHRRKSNNRSKADRAYGQFQRMIEYKSKLYGKELIKVNRYYPSSQLCSNCGYQNPLLKDLSVRKWECPECGQIHDRDINAAINILNEGLRLRSS